MIRVFDDPELLAQAAAARITETAVATIAAHGRFRIALSGGATPRRLYQILGGAEYRERIPWDRVEILFADERAVSPGDPASNYRLVREALIEPAGILEARVRRMRGDDVDLERAAWEYESALADPPDLVLLGIGEDGHTASLFPGSPALDEADRRVVAVVAPKPPPRRLTITPRVLREAAALWVLASGAGKAAAVALALEGPPAAVPAGLARHGDWYLDRDAAKTLSQAAGS